MVLVLVSGGVLLEFIYCVVVKEFGEYGVVEFFYFVGVYCMVFVMFNIFDVLVLD